LPDYLSRFRVRAAMKLARGFSRQHRIIHFTTIGSASGLRLLPGGFTYLTSYTLTPGQPPPGLDYLPASPHHSPTNRLVQRLHHSDLVRRLSRRLHGLSITMLDVGRSTAGTGISTGYPSTTPV